jgi:putative ABC transport system permease protein
MILKYLKISFREVKKHTFLTSINILGLAAGLCASLILFIYVNRETGYDTFNKNADRIYKLNSIIKTDTEYTKTGINRAEAKGAIDANVPEVEKVAKIYLEGYGNLYVGETRFTNRKMLYADPEITDIFTYETIAGDLSTALIESNCAIIDETTARMFYGDENPIGKSFRYEQDQVYTVKAVVKDLPIKSHYTFNIIASSHEWMKEYKNGGLEYVIYMLFREGCNVESVINKCNEQNIKINTELFSKYGAECDSEVQKLTDVYLKSDYNTRLGAQGNINSVYLYSAIAFLILVIAIINYINLFTAHYKTRIREFSMHKILGAEKRDMLYKLITTSGLLTFISATLSVILTHLLLPEVNALFGRKLEFSFMSSPGVWFIVVVIGTALISGLYPALIMMKQPLSSTMRGQTTKSGKTRFTGSLVVFQFVISILTIISVLVIIKQINYLKDYDLGYEPDKVVVISRLNKTISDNKDAIFQEFMNNPNIAEVSSCVHSPTGGTSGQGVHLAHKGEANDISINEKRVHAGYFSTLGIELIEGKEFKDQANVLEDAVIINETAARALGEKNLVGKTLSMNGNKLKIIGIAKDYHYWSLRNVIEPIMFTYYNPNPSFILLRTHKNPDKAILKFAQDVVKEFDSAWDNKPYILGDSFGRRYRLESRTKQLVIYGGSISIMLSLLGLFALSLFMLKYKSKEIGIRKVNGATVIEIIFMLNKTYLRWILLSFIIATPIAIYLLNKWLQRFAYKTDMSWWIFIVSGIAVAIVASATVWIQTYRAARQNPVEILKYE